MSLWRSELAEKTMTKLELAQRQLETAIGLFVSRRDRISAIMLAGATDREVNCSTRCRLTSRRSNHVSESIRRSISHWMSAVRPLLARSGPLSFFPLDSSQWSLIVKVPSCAMNCCMFVGGTGCLLW